MAALNPKALEALTLHQRQLDMDGVEVGVSRQALDELISAYLSSTSAGVTEEQTHPTPVSAPVGVEQIMEQAQVFASSWSLVGGRFDSGNALADAEEAKDDLRAMVLAALRSPAVEGK